ncbi:OmpA family protein [Desulfonema magnum]|uniref:OmpA-like domain-containing protein n=1 Tax=Desulfonema magnum TaxID=45655 RepID=A0A975BV90_9BACT|nr:OmpA family protein [Desulfonema magnum]QTA92450.1 OmpA-like domain-containing protein [Desulfonema magnum]
MMGRYFFVFFAIASISLSGMLGCATKKYVNEYVDENIRLLSSVKNKQLSSEIKSFRTEMEEDIGKVWKEIGENQKEISGLKDSVEKQKERIAELSVVEEALARAETAGKLAVGKLLYEVTMSDESVFFAYNEKELSKEAKLAINVFANVLLAQNKDIFIEIQGHTDNIGSKEYNLKLGHDRAETVRNYLYTEHNIPLHKMSTFSYGEEKPVVPNTNKINRSKNRRVMLLVME